MGQFQGQNPASFRALPESRSAAPFGRGSQHPSVNSVCSPHFPVLFLAINKRETLAQAGVWASRPALQGLHTAPASPHTSRSGAFVPQRDPFPDGAAETGPQQEGGVGSMLDHLQAETDFFLVAANSFKPPLCC